MLLMNQTATDSSPEAKNCLIIFAQQHAWYNSIISKFSLIYRTDFFFADEIFRRHGSKGIIEKANKLINDKNIEIVILDSDFLPYIDSAVISKLPHYVFKILITFDDLLFMHNVTAVNAYMCHLVLSPDSLTVLKYREKGINSEFMPLEAPGKIYKPIDLKKDIDVFFFGNLEKEGRKEYTDYLKKNEINLKVVGPPNEFVTVSELVILINRSKIVLNFSLTDRISEYSSVFRKCDCMLDKSAFQLKGRIFEAALCRTLCISEYAPAIGLLFNQNEVPMFKNELECLSSIMEFLNNETLRKETADRLYNKVIANYEDSVLMPNIQKVIEKIERMPKSGPTSRYYKDYVTRFKLRQCVESPFKLFKEIVFLHKNGILLFSPGVLVYIIRSFLRFFPAKILLLCKKTQDYIIHKKYYKNNH